MNIGIAMSFIALNAGPSFAATAGKIGSCDGIFASAKKPANKEAVTSIVSGSPVYQVVTGESGAKTEQGEVPGIYRRSRIEWLPALLGEVRPDDRGNPMVFQLALSRKDDRAYAVAVVDNAFYLITAQSDSKKPKSFFKIGSDDAPIFEVGSKQRRSISSPHPFKRISVHQDALYHYANSQVILISVEFAQPQASGNGMTIAIEVMTNENASTMRVNGDAVAIDYDFHDQKKLSTLAFNNQREFLVYSKILVEQFAATELGVVGKHLNHAKQLLTGYVNSMLKNIAPGQAVDMNSTAVAYNMSTQKVVKKANFTRQVYSDSLYTVEQRYLAESGEQAMVEIVAGGDRDQLLRIPGAIDFLPNGKPAVWKSETNAGLLLRQSGLLYLALYDQESGHVNIYDLKSAGFSGMKAETSADFNFSVHVPNEKATEEMGPIHKIVVIISGRAGKLKRTFAVRINKIPGGFSNVDATFEVAPFEMSAIEIGRRLTFDGPDLLFDAMTPQVKTISSYEQRYDGSRPHIDLYKTPGRTLAYRFKKPTRTSPLADSVTYAEFSLTKGVEDPTGIYFGREPAEITGNETSHRVLGELVLNPSFAGELSEKDPLRQFRFADTTLEKAYVEGETISHSDLKRKATVFAVDANRKNGHEGYKFILVIGNSEGKNVVLTLPPALVFPSLTMFRDIALIRGQKKDDHSFYIVLSYRKPSTKTKTIESTMLLRLNLEELDKASAAKAHDEDSDKEIQVTFTNATMADIAVTSADLSKRIGFRPDGVPTFILSSQSPPDAHDFQLFDFHNFTKVFPNHLSGKDASIYKEIKFGDYKSFAGNSQYVTFEDTWSAWKVDIKNKNPGLGLSKELAQFDSFIEIGKELENLASPSAEPQRLLLVVPQSLRNLVWDFVMSKAVAPVENPSSAPRFNLESRSLSLNLISETRASQRQYLANLDSMDKMARLDPDLREFLVARLDEINAWHVEQSKNENEGAFRIREVTAASDPAANLGGETTTGRNDRLPHPLYLLATSKAMSLRDFRARKPKPQASMVVVATPEEMLRLEETARAEIENGLLESFRIHEIKDPDHDSMALALTNIFSHVDVKSLDYNFSAEQIRKHASQMSPENQFDTVIDYAVSRFSFFVNEKKEPLFESFMRFRAAFLNGVTADRQARRSRLIDKGFVERVLTQVFDIPMNLSTLAPDDPIKVLSAPNALLKWQEAGYHGPFGLKESVRETILSQTRSDAAKPVPSTVMIFGNTGSGKTFLFQTLIKMLKLKIYDPTRKDDYDAQAFIVSAANLKEKEGTVLQPDVDQMIQEMENFLALPSGYRGFILIDDIHAAKNEVKAKLINWLRGVFESPNGMRLLTNGTRRPVRNLNIFVTVNPTSEQDQIAKFAKNKANPTLEETLLATLSTPENKVETSFLRRFGRIVNLDFMPAGAKGPELVNSMAKASNTLLNTHNRIALVDPTVVTSLVAGNATIDARTFLSASTNGLIEAAARTESDSSIVMIVPANYYYQRPRPGGQKSDDNPAERIGLWVRQNTRSLALDSGLEGRLIFTKMVVDAFRIPVYESLALALQADPRFAGDQTSQKTVLTPILAAISDHIGEHVYVPLKEIPMSAHEYGMKTTSEREVFRNTVLRLTEPDATPLFPTRYRAAQDVSSSWSDVLNRSSKDHAEVSDVLARMVLKNRDILQTRLVQIMRLRALGEFPDADSWVRTLKPQSELDPKRAGVQMVDDLWELFPRIMAEYRPGADEPILSTYAATRLYLYAVDRAMMQLPWVESATFMLKALEMITQDQVLSQKPGVQAFLFTDPHRLIRPTIPDFVDQIITSSHSLVEVSVEKRQRDRDDFARDQDKYLEKLAGPR